MADAGAHVPSALLALESMVAFLIRVPGGNHRQMPALATRRTLNAAWQGLVATARGKRRARRSTAPSWQLRTPSAPAILPPLSSTPPHLQVPQPTLRQLVLGWA